LSLVTPLPDLLPILLIVAALVAFVAIAVARLRTRMRARKPSIVTPVAVPPEEIELAEGPVSACMRCGSPNVRPASFSEGGIPGSGAMLFYICARCGHRGPPLEFPDTTAYRQFVKALHGEPGGGDGQK
jgi:DNA-directed RNA polymerase subunit RPC12/RpoP